MAAITNLFLFTITCELLIIVCNANVRMRKEAYLSVPKLIQQAGYPVENHRATTLDGYVIQLHRIPAARRTAKRSVTNWKNKKAVLIMHGILGSSSDFVIMGPERSLGYILADAGYDVWLGNLRGNCYTSHRNLTRDNPRFWDYSFHEHGLYDLPAQIDKILNVTCQRKILYIGYSMGTSSFFAMMSERPEYNDKVISFIALAPAVYLDNIKQFASWSLKTMDFINAMRNRNIISFNLRPEFIDMMVNSMCSTKRADENICIKLAMTIVGEDYEQNDWDMTAIILHRFQAASWRQFEHFGKIAITGVFTQWKDGLWGEVKPYNLSNVKIPVAILYGENDQITEKSQIMRLSKELNRTGVLDTIRPACSWQKFNHIDFIFAKDLGKLLTRPLVKQVRNIFNKYGGS